MVSHLPTRFLTRLNIQQWSLENAALDLDFHLLLDVEETKRWKLGLMSNPSRWLTLILLYQTYPRTVINSSVYFVFRLISRNIVRII